MRLEDSSNGWISSAYTRLVYPVFDRRSCQGLRKRLRRYQDLERLSLEANKALQWRALIQLLQHAYDSTGFYRQRFDRASVHPSEITSASDLQAIPPLTRDDIRSHLPELQSQRYRLEELLHAATGGTTDTPVPILRSSDSVREKAAVQWRFNAWAGHFPGNKVFYLWGARQDYAVNPSWRWRLYDRHLMRRIWAPTSLFNETVLESYRQMMNDLRPGIVYAYPTPLALFCEYLRSCGRPFHQPLSAICTAEPLLASQRRIIEEVLGCPLFEHYGSREFGMIAANCEHRQGLHLNTAAAYVENLPMQGCDADGLQEILVTDLLNYGMPLIRYRINDCVLPGATQVCPCGRGLPLIGRIEGRTTDVFRLANGDVIPGVALTNRLLQVCPALKKTQVIQETVEDFRVRYVLGPGFDSSQLEFLTTKLRKFFPEQVSFTFEQVADIERERSGKTRFCISRVADPAGRRVQAI
jgi:phenylacetate-CoA ligase